MSRFARVIVFDKRGTGLSDRSVDVAGLDVRMDDVRAVMDAVGSERAALVGASEGGPMSILFAATFPERTHSLTLYGSMASFVALVAKEQIDARRRREFEHIQAMTVLVRPVQAIQRQAAKRRHGVLMPP